MLIRRIYYLLLSLLIASVLHSQEDYNAFYKAMNPAPDSLPHAEKLQIITNWLEAASAQDDTLKMIHGHMYLANLYHLRSDYSANMRHILIAEELANLQQNVLLLGRIWHKKGAVYFMMDDLERAAETYKVARDYNAAAQDSQNMAITYEQLGAVATFSDSFHLAQDYYELALPMVRTYGSRKSLAVTLGNYGSVFAHQNQKEEAIRYYQESLALSREIGNKFQVAARLTDIGKEYLSLEQYEQAATLFYEAMALSKQNDWPYNLLHSYDGLAGVHEGWQQLDSAIYYHHEYGELKDSLFGPQAQAEVRQLDTDQLMQKKEAQLDAEQSRSYQVILVSAGILALLCIILIALYVRSRENSRKLALHRQQLAELTKELQARNASLQETTHFDAPIANPTADEDEKAIPNIDVYDTRILRNEDWYNFKALFEKSYPGYVRRLREAYPDLSEAEERLFLLLKLNLTTPEIASTLGIQRQSVKKTRTRLRRRLGLESSQSLTTFVSEF